MVTVLSNALTALEQAGVPVRLRKPMPSGLPGHRELDLWLDPTDVSAADGVLAGCGFHRVRVRGHAPHRFYVTVENGAWYKVDAKLTARTAVPRRLGSVMRRAPAGIRRYGPVLAVLGPDGAGKSTLLAGLRDVIPLAVNVTYLGGRRAPASDGPAIARQRSPRFQRLAGSPPGELAFVARHLLRRTRALARVYARAWAGTIVLCDRHPIETLAIGPRRNAAAGLLERFAAERLLPWPDVVVVLDAPPEVLYARKQEHPLDRLRTWRQRYREVFAPRGARFVLTDGSPEEALEALAGHVFEALTARTRRRRVRSGG